MTTRAERYSLHGCPVSGLNRYSWPVRGSMLHQLACLCLAAATGWDHLEPEERFPRVCPSRLRLRTPLLAPPLWEGPNRGRPLARAPDAGIRRMQRAQAE